MAKTELTVILPGLATVLEQRINAGIIPPYLAKIIAKSSFQKKQIGLSRLLFNLFSETELTGSDLPIRFLESGQAGSLRVDPCYLHADRDRLLLFTDGLALSANESDQLIAEIQPLFEEFGGKVIQSSPNNWCLELESMPELSFSALPDVAGKGIENALPKGVEQRDWIRLWNEVQMKLYNSELNQQRTDDNKLPINSVWFWGAGSFDIKNKAWDKVQGKSELLEQLAAKSHSTLESNSDYSITSLTSGKHLWLADEFIIDGDWLQQLEVFDETVLKPLWQQCRQARLAKVDLHIPEYGSYQLTPLDCWKFW
ncbi:MAG: hypothetical protein PSN44_08635 [Gammaproteobacteria bacterium]|nr:hypothetical protein [Gammaproteobacteria bacterium]